METYILFLSGGFSTRKELDHFTTSVFVGMEGIFSIKYIFEKKDYLIVVFDSELDEDLLLGELQRTLFDETIKLYFLFNIRSMIGHKMPEEIKAMVDNNIPKDSVFFIEIFTREDYDIDDLLDKIEKHGIESLTSGEKKFLDSFEK